jgi:hypothetical protein
MKESIMGKQLGWLGIVFCFLMPLSSWAGPLLPLPKSQAEPLVKNLLGENEEVLNVFPLPSQNSAPAYLVLTQKDADLLSGFLLSSQKQKSPLWPEGSLQEAHVDWYLTKYCHQVVLEDIDGDKKPEVFILNSFSTRFRPGGQPFDTIEVFNWDGTHMIERPYLERIFDDAPFHSKKMCAPLSPQVTWLKERTLDLQRKGFRELSDQEFETQVKPYFQEGENSSFHPVFSGPFGPAPNTLLVLTEVDKVGGGISGFALVPDGKGMKRIPLPLENLGADRNLEAVFWKDFGSDGKLEIFVLHSMLVSGNLAGYQTAVIYWDGQAFRRRPDLEKRLRGLPTAHQVLSRLH